MNTRKLLRNTFIMIFLFAISLFLVGCVGFGTCSGKGNCNGVATCEGFGKCDGSGVCEGKGVCEGFGVCEGITSCEGVESVDASGVKTCNGKGVCKGLGRCEGIATCQGKARCDGTGKCDGSGYCEGLGSCWPFSAKRDDASVTQEPKLEDAKAAQDIGQQVEQPLPLTYDSSNIGQLGSVQVPANKALIYLYRPDRFAGSGNTYQISINRKPVADMSVGTRLYYAVPPGHTTLQGWTLVNILNIGLGFLLMEKPDIVLDTKAGEVYFVDIKTGFAGGPQFDLVDDATGLEAVKGLRFAMPPK